MNKKATAYLSVNDNTTSKINKCVSNIYKQLK